MLEYTDGGDVGRQERVRRVLEVLVSSECAMPKAVIFRNAKLRGADFEERSVTNYLRDLYDDGYVRKVDPDALEDGDLVDISLSDEGYFIATDKAFDEFE